MFLKENMRVLTQPPLAPIAHVWLLFQDTGASGTAAQQPNNQLGEVENLEDFAYSPAPRGITVKCRITRDRKGMDRGLFPTYYMHLEKDENRKVWELILKTDLEKRGRMLWGQIVDGSRDRGLALVLDQGSQK